MKPTFSIIIPVYNVEPYLRECLDSVMAQTVEDWESICVDDGSTDGSGAILDEYAAKDQRFRVIHQANAGVSEARNKGLDEAKGEWISFIDADDWIDKAFLAKLCQVSRVSQTDIVFSCVKKVFEAGDSKIIGPGHSGLYAPEDLYTTYNSLCAWSWGKIYRSRLWKGVRFPVGIAYSEDRYILHEVLYQLKKVAVVTDAPYFYRMRGDSAYGSEWNPAKLQQRLGLKRQIDFFSAHGYDKALYFTVGLYFKWISPGIAKLDKCGNHNEPSADTMRVEMREVKRRYWGGFVRYQRKEQWEEFPSITDLRVRVETAISHHGRISPIRRLWYLIAYDGLYATIKRFCRKIARYWRTFAVCKRVCVD